MIGARFIARIAVNPFQSVTVMNYLKVKIKNGALKMKKIQIKCYSKTLQEHCLFDYALAFTQLLESADKFQNHAKELELKWDDKDLEVLRNIEKAFWCEWYQPPPDKSVDPPKPQYIYDYKTKQFAPIFERVPGGYDGTLHAFVEFVLGPVNISVLERSILIYEDYAASHNLERLEILEDLLNEI